MAQGPTIRTVLIPVDGSKHADKALLIGAAIAAKFRARVILLHVLLRNLSHAKMCELAERRELPSDLLERIKAKPAVYDFGLTVPASIIGPAVPTELLVEVGRHILETGKSMVQGQGVRDVDLQMEDHEAADRIIEIAKKEKADLVVMGRRGLGAVEGMLAGSVSTKVSHLAPATVVSVT